MDDLISRKAAIDALEFERDCIDQVEDAIEIIQQLPSINAVPLDKLCEWLEKNATMDCDGCHATIGSCEDDDVNERVCNSRERWKKMLTKWMGGLDGRESMV